MLRTVLWDWPSQLLYSPSCYKLVVGLAVEFKPVLPPYCGKVKCLLTYNMVIHNESTARTNLYDISIVGPVLSNWRRALPKIF